MNKLKQNAFWAGLGAAGIVLVLAAVYWVGGGMTEASSAAGTVRTETNQLTGLRDAQLIPGVRQGVPGQDDIKAWKARRDEFIAEYKSIKEFYGKRDESLERWFAGLNRPSYDQFSAPYLDSARKVEELLRKANPPVKVGYPVDPEQPDGDGKFGFNWSEVSRFAWGTLSGDERAEVVRTLQKRFWICQHIANACVRETGVTRLKDVHFFAPLADPTKHPEMMPARPSVNEEPGGVNYVGNPAAAGGPGLSRFDEFLLPDNGLPPKDPKTKELVHLGKTITFGVTVTIPYDKVPRFIREMLNPNPFNDVAGNLMQPLLINVLACRVFVPNQNELELTKSLRIPDTDTPAQRNQKIAEAKAQAEEGIKPRAVQLRLTCQAIDFDPAALPEWANN